MNNQNEESGPLRQRDQPATDTKPVIVAIGASAGGVQALQAFIGALPEKSGAAFVVVVHLDPEKRSELSNILGLRTRMPVVRKRCSAICSFR
jgi:chemotaxis response regulator CheB